MRDDPLFGLVGVLAPLSLLAVGGGQSVVADMHRQVVQQHHWITESQFVTDYLLSRIAPGPASLVVMLIGHQAAGPLGAVAAMAAMFLPSSLLVCVIARIWARHEGAPWRASVQRGLAPIAAGLVLATSLTLLQSTGGGWIAWLLAAAAAGVLLVSKIHPLVMIALGAAAFLGLGAMAGAAGWTLPA
jgi:chromate transporter